MNTVFHLGGELFFGNSEYVIILTRHILSILGPCYTLRLKQNKLECGPNAQSDGRPAEYRCRPLFNAAKFGLRPLLECSAITLPRRETR